jgi:hypothetical protein
MLRQVCIPKLKLAGKTFRQIDWPLMFNGGARTVAKQSFTKVCTWPVALLDPKQSSDYLDHGWIADIEDRQAKRIRYMVLRRGLCHVRAG